MIEINNLFFQYYSKKRMILQDISLKLSYGKIAVLVGNSGSGKTTLAKIIIGLLPYQNGIYLFEGKDVKEMSVKNRKKILFSNIQYIFQDAKESLHPAKTIQKTFQESLFYYNKMVGTKRKIDFSVLLEKVDLSIHDLNKYPRDFSGGQCQRIAIARALIAKPKLLIADEPISSSDVITQAKLLQLFKQLNKEENLSILFITHDIFVANYLADWVIVMKDGKIIEQNDSDKIFKNPQNDFTKKILHY